MRAHVFIDDDDDDDLFITLESVDGAAEAVQNPNTNKKSAVKFFHREKPLNHFIWLENLKQYLLSTKCCANAILSMEIEAAYMRC